MRPETAALLRSPTTGEKLDLEAFIRSGDEVVDGRLIESATGEWYRIEDGIADLTPAPNRDTDRDSAFCGRYGLKRDRSPAVPKGHDTHAAEQIRFFSSYQNGYEADVVRSPFYEILYRITVDRWLLANLKAGALVAEVGCGSAHQTLHILRQGGTVVGVDLSEDMLRQGRRKVRDQGYSGRADFVVGTAESLPLAAASFDAAVICGSLHHFSDPAAALLKLSTVLRTDGKLYLLEPHKSPLRFIFDWTMRKWPLWQEEAGEDPLFEAHQFRAWLTAGGIQCRIKYSTYLPPHLFYAVKGGAGDALLSATDRVFGSVPGLRRLAGVIIAEGTKTV